MISKVEKSLGILLSTVILMEKAIHSSVDINDAMLKAKKFLDLE